MKKFIRVFVSQIFNAVFPIIIILVLISIKEKNDITSIFLLINYANFYLLFTDYSSNIIFLKEALQTGGIKVNTEPAILQNINIYLTIKCLFLSVGFIVWLLICYFSPVLHAHFIQNVLGYTFIIGYNLNFYWVYMSSPKEFYFIISNLFARLSLLLVLLLFIFTNLNLSWLMCIVGVLNIAISWLYFKRFCAIYNIETVINKPTIQQSIAVIKRDFSFMSSSFLLMTPTNCLSLFLGFVKNTAVIPVYSLAEKVFFAVRTLLSVFINSIYPSFLNNELNGLKKRGIMFTVFYGTIITICIFLYFGAPTFSGLLKLKDVDKPVLYTCLHYFIATILILSVNVPFMLWMYLKNMLSKPITTFGLIIAAILITTEFTYYSVYENDITNIAKSLMIAEGLIVIVFIVLYIHNKYKKTTSTSLQ